MGSSYDHYNQYRAVEFRSLTADQIIVTSGTKGVLVGGDTTYTLLVTPEDQGEVGDVASDHVAEGYLVAPGHSCDEGHHQFRAAGAKGHNRSGHGEGAHSGAAPKSRSARDKVDRPEVKGQDPNGYEEEMDNHDK